MSDKIHAINNEKQNIFENKYHLFFQELSKLPRKDRMEFYANNVDREEFAGELLEAAQNDKMQKLKKKLENLDGTLMALDEISSMNKKQYDYNYMDGLTAMEILGEALESFNLYKDGQEQSFCHYFNFVFSRRRKMAENVQIFNNLTNNNNDRLMNYTDEIKSAIVTAKFAVESKLEQLTDYSDQKKSEKLDQLINDIINEKSDLRKEDKALIYDLITNQLSFISMDAPYGDGDEEMSMHDVISDNVDEEFRINGDQLLQQEKDELIADVTAFWSKQLTELNNVNKDPKKRNLEISKCYQIFITTTFLNLLKLREITADMKETWIKEMGRKTKVEDFVKEIKEPGFKKLEMIRCNYVINDPNQPAGNSDWYNAMVSFEKIIYGYLFSDDFIKIAISQKTECLYDVFNYPLVEEHVFQDCFAAEKLGFKPSNFSKKHDKFRDKFKEHLLKKKMEKQ